LRLKILEKVRIAKLNIEFTDFYKKIKSKIPKLYGMYNIHCTRKADAERSTGGN